MKHYRIGLTQTVYEECTVTVEAASREEAEKLALEMAEAGNVHWRFLDCCSDAEVVTADEVDE